MFKFFKKQYAGKYRYKDKPPYLYLKTVQIRIKWFGITYWSTIYNISLSEEWEIQKYIDKRFYPDNLYTEVEYIPNA